MKQTAKIIITLCLAAALLFSIPVCAYASTNSAASIGVQLNGQLLDLGSNTPVSKDNRTFIPFRSILTALGATVNYNQATNTITAQKDDTTVSFKIGQANITITKDKTIQVLKTDAPSFASNNRTLVSVRFVAQAFGYKVGWDSADKTIIIIDMESLVAPYEGKFTVFDKFLAYNAKYSAGNYAFNGDMDLDMSISADQKTYPVAVTGTLSGLISQDSEEMDLNFSLDAQTIEALLSASQSTELDTQTQDLLTALENLDIHYIINFKTGVVYMSSPIFAQGLGLQNDDWLSLNYDTLLAQSGTDTNFEDLISLAKTTSTCYLEQEILNMLPVTSVTDYEDIVTTLQMVENAVGDRAFTQNGSVYTAKANLTYEGSTIVYQFDLTMKNDTVSAYTFSLSVLDETVNLTLNASQNANDVMKLTMTMDMPDTLSLDLTMNMNYKKTTEVPALAPPEGATVMPMDGLF